jgi:hypothetical protein
MRLVRSCGRVKERRDFEKWTGPRIWPGLERPEKILK